MKKLLLLSLFVVLPSELNTTEEVYLESKRNELDSTLVIKTNH